MEGSVSVLWWEEVSLCRCIGCFFSRKDEVRETRKGKQREKKEPTTTKKTPTHEKASGTCSFRLEMKKSQSIRALSACINHEFHSICKMVENKTVLQRRCGGMNSGGL